MRANIGVSALSIRAIIRAVFCALGFYLCGGTAVLAASASPILLAEPTAVDFGAAAPQQVLVAKIKLTNRGSEPISILSISSSCECTVATTDDATIASGEITMLTIKSETRAHTGNIRRTIIVHATSGDLAISVQMVIAPPTSGPEAAAPHP